MKDLIGEAFNSCSEKIIAESSKDAPIFLLLCNERNVDQNKVLK